MGVVEKSARPTPPLNTVGLQQVHSVYDNFAEQTDTEMNFVEDPLLALEQRISDFMDSEDVYVMGVSDAKHYTFNRKAVGSITSRR